jgi:hypothetical protein
LVLFWVSASRLLLCGMGVEQNKLIFLHGLRPCRLPCPCSRGGAHFVSCADLPASHDQLPRDFYVRTPFRDTRKSVGWKLRQGPGRRPWTRRLYLPSTRSFQLFSGVLTERTQVSTHPISCAHDDAPRTRYTAPATPHTLLTLHCTRHTMHANTLLILHCTVCA